MILSKYPPTANTKVVATEQSISLDQSTSTKEVIVETIIDFTAEYGTKAAESRDETYTQEENIGGGNPCSEPRNHAEN